MTPNLIQTFKMKNHNTKHTQHIKFHFQKSNCFKTLHFPKLNIHSHQRFPLNFMARLWRAEKSSIYAHMFVRVHYHVRGLP